MQQDQHGKASIRCTEPWWSVDMHAAARPRGLRVIRMDVNCSVLAPRRVAAGDLENAADSRIAILDSAIARVRKADAIDGKRVQINTGFERPERNAPFRVTDFLQRTRCPFN